ncbi:glycosyl hydrolase family 28-related protein [Pelagicoccus sp. SDUM812003]|uniref:glycosyl hydrolase family 28-related protein n=1 Tax=Pelagicoccus sp. SDUM812003 TaxID=3041267 RepID=UPI00280FCC43|nr:glycosyl hydrolase family 28-related protein [Pelagicoccus sp. SDUM812003]MDQ8204152.1 glycosyl hydrolase family 28-related protein [Pelagicoccus sp. SDUM812003]
MRLSVAGILVVANCVAFASGDQIGAELPWVSYEAESMVTNGAIFGPNYQPHTIETESSAQRYVELQEAGDYVEFEATIEAQGVVLRFSLPDAPEGGGLESEVELHVNGRSVRDLSLSSRNSWLYGVYPFSNDPEKGKPRNAYDEMRVKGLDIKIGDTVRIQKSISDGVPCIVDIVDLEPVPAPLPKPDGAISVRAFGAKGDGVTDDTQALLDCLQEARSVGASVFVPEGDFKITRDIVLTDGDRIQGSGMWHTTFVGDKDLYSQADRRVRFKLTGENCQLADFAIVGELNYRNDQEANDGVIGSGCSDATIERIWIEHTKVGVWVYNGRGVAIEGCRFRNLLADGTNFCVGTTDSVVDNCSARGTGDDCYAIWPAAFDQGYVDDCVVPGNNVIRRSTGQLTFLANGASVYGGANNRVENCRFVDIGTGCGILISTTFPTSDPERGIDNNFSGTTLVEGNELLRCGGYDHGWAWRGSFQICMDRKRISGLAIRDMVIRDSISEGFTIVAPGAEKGEGTLSDTSLKSVRIFNSGIRVDGAADLFIRSDAQGDLIIRDSRIEDIENLSPSFSIQKSH